MRFGGAIISNVTIIWSEENSPERLSICLTYSETEVMSRSSVVALPLAHRVGTFIN